MAYSRFYVFNLLALGIAGLIWPGCPETQAASIFHVRDFIGGASDVTLRDNRIRAGADVATPS